MNNYKNAHRWLLLAFAIVILGFLRGYWSNFFEEEFGHHVHLMTATAWFVLLIWQPRLATTGRLAQHRRNGLIGLFLAGGVVASSLLMLPGNIEAAAGLEDGGFVGATFLYGITFFDALWIIGFAVSVVMAILRVKRPEEHALWMVSTAFWIISPAFARLMVLPIGLVFGFEDLTFIKVLYIGQPLVLAAIVITAWRLKTRHLALMLPLAANALIYAIVPIGDSPAWRALCDAVLG